jgi:sugar phosphate isomerase/epimerase
LRTIPALGLGQVAHLGGTATSTSSKSPYNREVPRVDVWLNGGTRSGACCTGTSASFRGHVGLQLWSLRDMRRTNIPIGLQTTRALGFTEVEVAGLPPGLPPAPPRRQPTSVSGNWSYDDVAKKLDKVVLEAKALGVRDVGVGWIPRPNQTCLHRDRRARGSGGFQSHRRHARERRHPVFLSPHGYEFVPHGAGCTPFDVLAEKTDPKHVSFEMDIFWAAHAGQDPVKLTQKHAGRWELMHLKDVRRGTATGPLTGAGHKTVRKVQRSAIPHSMNRRSLVSLGVIATMICALLPASLRAAAPPAAPFDRQNFVAWCIVPYDAKKRSPADRAEMIVRLGLGKVAYDWRKEHVPQFEAEILEYRKHGLEYFAFWDAHEDAFRLFEKYQLHPQIWITAPSPEGSTDQERIRLSAEKLRPMIERARKLGCKVGLYNHGKWGGEPENLVALCKYLREHERADHVGIVYNLHHGHGHVDRFAAALTAMKPYLLCLNVNGMTRDGDARGKKILAPGQGEFDLRLFQTIRDSGYRGPIGILGHTPNDDVEHRLRDDLDGIDWLVAQLDGQPAGPKPTPRTTGSLGYSPTSAPAAKK